MGAEEKGRFIFLSWGEGMHLPEIAFAIWSAQYFAGRDKLPAFAIYTDQPDRFERLPVQTIFISPQQFQDWTPAATSIESKSGRSQMRCEDFPRR